MWQFRKISLAVSEPDSDYAVDLDAWIEKAEAFLERYPMLFDFDLDYDGWEKERIQIVERIAHGLISQNGKTPPPGYWFAPEDEDAWITREITAWVMMNGLGEIVCEVKDNGRVLYWKDFADVYNLGGFESEWGPHDGIDENSTVDLGDSYAAFTFWDAASRYNKKMANTMKSLGIYDINFLLRAQKEDVDIELFKAVIG